MGEVINGWTHPDFCNCPYHAVQAQPKPKDNEQRTALNKLVTDRGITDDSN